MIRNPAEIRNHGGAVDPDGEIVKPAPGRYADLQAALKRYHPELKIGFDRANHHWVIYREDKELVPIDAGEDIKFQYTRPFVTIVLKCLWYVKDEDRKIFAFPRDPDEWIFRHLERFKKPQFEVDSSEFMTKHYTDQAVSRREAEDAKRKQDVSDIVDDWMPHYNRETVVMPAKENHFAAK